MKTKNNLSLITRKNSITMNDLKDFLRQFPKLPKEVVAYLSDLDEKELSQRPFKKLYKGFLPFLFEMNVWGGWITPDANWYLPTLGSDTDLPLKRRLKNPARYQHNARLQGFREGFVRLDWKQPVFDTHFSVKKTQTKKLIFTFDPQTLKNRKVFNAVQHIATFYTIAGAPPLLFEIVLVSYDGDKLLYRKKKFNQLSFFVLELTTIRYKL